MYFKSLLEGKRLIFMEFKQQRKPNVTLIHIQTDQIKEAIASTKLRKSLGPGGIYPEFIRYGPEKFLRCINEKKPQSNR